MLFFKKRRISDGLSRLASFATHPSSLKILLLSIALGAAFLFRMWTERGEEHGASMIETPAVPVIPAPASPPPTSVSALTNNEISPAEKIDLNSAPVERLESLPGVGPKLAKEMIAYRERGGVFHRAEDLLQVKGIGPNRLHRLEPYLRFESNDKQ